MAATLLIGAMAATPASAAFSSPFTLSPSERDAVDPQVAVGDNVDPVFVWRRFDGSSPTCCFRVQARAQDGGTGTLSPVQTLSAPGQDASPPQVAVDADGDAVITWVRSDGSNDRMQAQARSADGVLSPVQDVSPAGQDASLPQVAIDDEGDAVFTWQRPDETNQRIKARARSAAGTLSGVQNLSEAGRDAVDPEVGVDADGDAVFTWRRQDSTNAFRAQTRARSAGGALSEIKTLSASVHSAFEPEVAVDPDGDAVFTWFRSDGTNRRIQTRARTSAGALSAVQTLSPPGQDAVQAQVAVDEADKAIFTWRRSDGTNSRIQTRARTSLGALSPVQDLSDAGQDAFNPQVAADNGLDAVFTWQRSDGSKTRIQARTRADFDGSLGPVQNLSDRRQNAFLPQVAVDFAGNAWATWQRSDGAHIRIQGAVGP
jgi:hypothetical protein